ncbi:hypothetical protein ACFL0S_12230, partial [Thermodesulfobacteriota bacterium]
ILFIFESHPQGIGEKYFEPLGSSLYLSNLLKCNTDREGSLCVVGIKIFNKVEYANCLTSTNGNRNGIPTCG